MPQRLRRTFKWKNFNLPVSYKANVKDRMRDARNVCSIQDILRTRNGYSRYNGTAISSSDVETVSFYKNESGTRHILAKCGTKLVKVATTGASTDLKTGLTSSYKHRSVELNGRCFIAIEQDGIYSYNGSTFTQLGQAAPSTPSVATGTGSLTNSTYKVAITFYASTIGFESNYADSANVTTSSQGIDVTDIPTTAANALIDKVRIYLQDVTNNGNFLFVTEISLGTASYTIAADPTSTQTPPAPTTASPPYTGGAKYLAVFGKRLVYSGNSTYPTEVFFSNEYEPDAFNYSSNGIVVRSSGQGPITGIATGFYNQDNLAPYLCIFTKSSVEVYSDISGMAKISNDIGCINHDTIIQKDGDIYFMSNNGWYVISNGRLVRKDRKAFKLGDGDIDNIFNENGYVYEINKTNFDNYHAVYYPTLNQYLTFVSEGANTGIFKAYNFEFDIGGFRPYEFPLNFNGSCLAEDSNGEEIILLAGDSGRIYKHSINESRTDVDASNSSVNIAAFAQLYWINHEDLDATMNFGTMDFKALSSDNQITVKCFLNYELDAPTDKGYDFNKEESGFILDVSLLDVGILGDGRTIVRGLGEVNKTAQALLIGFYQTAADADMGLIEGQIDASKNGNPNYF